MFKAIPFGLESGYNAILTCEIVEAVKELWDDFDWGSTNDMDLDLHTLSSIPLCGVKIIDEANGQLAAFYLGTLTPHLLSKKQTVLSEICWAVMKPYRGGPVVLKLLNEINKLAMSVNADSLTLCVQASMDDRIGELLTKKGYDKIETVFQKRLNPCQNLQQ